MKGIYINLESRKDRRDHFESEVKRHPFFAGIERMNAVENRDGAIGCGLSHIKALQLDSDGPYIAIIEDDFMILDEKNMADFVEAFEKIKDIDDWKVIVLTPRGITMSDQNEMGSNEMLKNGFKRIKENQTTTGYIVKKEMIPILRDNIREAILLQVKGEDKIVSSIDQFWKRLQIEYPFYYYSGIFAGQLPGWSNIENRFVDYNDRFILQNSF